MTDYNPQTWVEYAWWEHIRFRLFIKGYDIRRASVVAERVVQRIKRERRRRATKEALLHWDRMMGRRWL